MEMRGIMGGFYRACEWIVRLSYVNILWVGFTLLGLVAFGLFPATVAVFSISRRWIQGDTELPIFPQFWSIFRKEFRRSNLLGLILVIFGAIIIFDLYFFQNIEGMFSQIVYFIMIAVLFNFFVMLLYVFPVYVHYDLKLFQTIKYALVIGMSNPFHTFSMILSLVFIYFLLEIAPAAFLFLSVAPLSWLIMLTNYRIFSKLEEKKKAEEKSINRKK